MLWLITQDLIALFSNSASSYTKDHFQAIYDATVIYEGREGNSVQPSPPDIFGVSGHNLLTLLL